MILTVGWNEARTGDSRHQGTGGQARRLQPKPSACAGRQKREVTMNRRQTLGLLVLVPMSGPALSQTAARVAVPEAERNHALRTLQAGSASLETSRVAISKGTAAGIKRFAQAESAEQQTLAQVLKARLGLDDNDKVAMPAEGKAGSIGCTTSRPVRISTRPMSPRRSKATGTSCRSRRIIWRSARMPCRARSRGWREAISGSI